MKPSGFALYRYELPLTGSLQLAGAAIDVRSGLLVCFTNEEGLCGWGDCAPLPGFSRESLVEAECQLRGWLENTMCWRHGFIDVGDLLPSVCFALETAMFNFKAAALGWPLARVLDDSPGKDILVNRLLNEGDEIDCGSAPVIKVKVAKKSIAEEVSLLSSLREKHGESVALIADANRGWSVSEAESFWNDAKALNLLYIEEPVNDPRLLSDLEMPVALDETLLERKPEEVCDWNSVVAYVIKPTLMGSLQSIHDWSEQARMLDLHVVVSACYESGVGIWNLANLAAALPVSKHFAGLDTYNRLKVDILSGALSLAKSPIPVDTPFAQNFEVNETQLELIADG